MWYVPGLAKVYVKVSLVSKPPERNSPPSPTTLCGSSSRLSHVIATPALTVSDTGVNLKSLIRTLGASAARVLDDVHAGHAQHPRQ